MMANKLYSLINIKRIYPSKKNKIGFFQIIEWDTHTHTHTDRAFDENNGVFTILANLDLS